MKNIKLIQIVITSIIILFSAIMTIVIAIQLDNLCVSSGGYTIPLIGMILCIGIFTINLKCLLNN